MIFDGPLKLQRANHANKQKRGDVLRKEDVGPYTGGGGNKRRMHRKRLQQEAERLKIESVCVHFHWVQRGEEPLEATYRSGVGAAP